VTTVIASAPGKIVLCGEYAVLDGAPAVCMAIDRYARVEVSPAVRECITVRTRGHTSHEWKAPVAEGVNVRWSEDVPELLLEAWNVVAPGRPFDVDLDTDEFFDPVSGSKIGFGSSAALTVALVCALLRASDDPRDATVLSHLAHRRLQHGQGSGVDVATSIRGGVIEYRKRNSGTSRVVRWPAGLEYGVLWSGREASTSDKLTKLGGARRGSAAASAARLCDLSESVATIWSAGNTNAILDALRRYVDVLMRFDIDHGLGIFEAGHGALAEAAKARNLVYKPCGAGGGDIGMIFASGKMPVEEFAQLAGERGFQYMDVALDANGVIVESKEL
jgi:phosphomevalonate kinase